MAEHQQSNGHDVDVAASAQTAASDALAQLRPLWEDFGLSADEVLQQKSALAAVVKRSCQQRVNAWRREIERATARVVELERDVQAIKAQFRGDESAGRMIRPLDQLCCGPLRDRLAALEMEFKFLDSVRASRVDDVSKLREHLAQMDAKLGTTSALPTDASDLSEEYRDTLQKLVATKSREVHMRRAALLEAVGECVSLARELQIPADCTFEADVNARLKKRDLTPEMLQKISQRTVELRELKVKREARLAEMLGEIQDLWQKLQISEDERSRFRKTVKGVSRAALASCEAELTRLQRHHKRFAATAVQVTNLRNTIAEYWDLLGYSSDQRSHFAAMMTTPNSDLSYKVFRAHEKEAERLKRQLFGMRVLTNYVVKREEVLQVRAEHGVPDERTRLRIERELPKYTAILHNRIAKWQKETGVVFCWNGQPYLEQMRADGHEYGKEENSVQDNQTSFGAQTRHSIEERRSPRIEVAETQLRRRRSDPQAAERPRWRNFIRATFARRAKS
ncbi:Anaphase spindle elongation protein 1 [Phytophthora cinnamomi]|uniref:Anaphase spindle elongation protein 1 n=1 Tax=Phytophthora cinnamomi TaxID=4785 RepID=UPI00355A6EBF|nr:Anaphase spindle elongation protein 1 [Phytophthora cinnamomi]